MANVWIREDLLERLNKLDIGTVGVHNKQDSLRFLLDFYEKHKDKVKQKKGNK